MEWWRKVIFPVRRVWITLADRVRARKNGAGLLKLHDDVQTCGYEDIQVMWNMLRRSESDHLPVPKPTPKSKTKSKLKARPFWRILVWSNTHGTTS